MDYEALHELLRKEKYSEQLQPIQKNLILEVAKYFEAMRKEVGGEDIFSGGALAEKKQLENAISIFRELMLRRKKKILNLVFVASETGIMKRDFGNMLKFEQELFENLVSSVDSADKELNALLKNNGKKTDEVPTKMLVIFDQDVEAFVDMDGDSVGPFKTGMISNLKHGVGEILVNDGRAREIDGI